MTHTAEFDISMLIYLALAILAAVGSAFQKRAQAKKNANPAPETKPDPWDEIFEEPEMKETEYEQTPKTFYEPDFEPKETVATYKQKKEADEIAASEAALETPPAWSSIGRTGDDLFGQEAFLEPAYEYEDVIKATEIKGVDQTSQKPKIEIDLKQAIIYSEIINRKY